jgi:hypothetical protein
MRRRQPQRHGPSRCVSSCCWAVVCWAVPWCADRFQAASRRLSSSRVAALC